MKIRQTLGILLASALLAGISVFPASAHAQDVLLDKAVNGTHRSPSNIARDRFRHPAETLTFFEVAPDMTVVEIWPGGGWYTEVLAPYLRDTGTLIAAHFAPESGIPYYRNSLKGFREKMASQPDIYGMVQLSILQPPEQVDFAMPGTVDRVLTFRNVHNWMKAGQAETVFRAMYRALKPGGILGVVEHRASTEHPQDSKALSGYVREDYVIKLAEDAGFSLAATSEINANPADDHEHPEGVWSLLPRLRVDESLMTEYREIGESDRMTLKFIKAR